MFFSHVSGSKRRGFTVRIVRQNIGVLSHFESQDLDSELYFMVYRMLCYGVVWCGFNCLDVPGS